MFAALTPRTAKNGCAAEDGGIPIGRDKCRRRYIGKSRAVRYDGTEKNAKALRYKKAKSADRIVYATKRNDE